MASMHVFYSKNNNYFNDYAVCIIKDTNRYCRYHFTNPAVIIDNGCRLAGYWHKSAVIKPLIFEAKKKKLAARG